MVVEERVLRQLSQWYEVRGGEFPRKGVVNADEVTTRVEVYPQSILVTASGAVICSIGGSALAPARVVAAVAHRAGRG